MRYTPRPLFHLPTAADGLRATFVATCPVPEFAAMRGDVIVVQPDHPHHPLLVVKRFGRDALPAVLGHLADLKTVQQTTADRDIADWLRRSIVGVVR